MSLNSIQRNCRHLMCMLLALGTARANANDQLTQRFLSEAPTAWKQLRELALTMKAEINSTSRDNSPDGSGEIREFVSQIRYNGMSGNLIFETEHTSGPWGGRRDVDGINDKYSFHAEQDLDQPLLVETVTPDSQIVMDSQAVRTTVFMPISANFVTVDELVADPSFSIDRISSVPDKDLELVEVHFRSAYVSEQGLRYPRGRILFDSGHLWTIVEFVGLFTVGGSDTVDAEGDDVDDDDTDDGEDVFWRIKNDYSAYENNGFPVPRRQLLELTTSDDLLVTDRPVFASRIMEFARFGPGDVRADDCTLRGIGLSEPAIINKRNPIRPPFVIVTMLLLIGVVAAGIKLAASRSSQEESPK